MCPGGWCLGLHHAPSCGVHRWGVHQHTGPCLPTPPRPSPPQGPLGPQSPFSFSPNMVRKTVKLMGAGASFTMASSSSFFTLMRPGGDTQEYEEGQRGPCLQAAQELGTREHPAESPSPTISPAPHSALRPCPPAGGPQDGGTFSHGQHWAAPSLTSPLPPPQPPWKGEQVGGYPHFTDEETETQRS